MPVNTNELLHAIALLTDRENMRVAVKESTKGAAICGSTCFVGGILGGPIGLAVGGALGGLGAAYFASGKLFFKFELAIFKLSFFLGKFKAVGDIIRDELSNLDRQRLYDHLVKTLKDVDITDLAAFLPLLMGSVPIQKDVLKTVSSFITNQMHMQLME